MDDLEVRIRASLENPNVELWFPKLTPDLADRAWEMLTRDFALTPDVYGTERVSSRTIYAPHDIITVLRTSSSSSTPTIVIEALSKEYALQCNRGGVTFYSPNEILTTTVLSCIEEALVIIDQVPSLMSTVASLVRSFHVLKPRDADHDVSFSEPEVPFSIFVSVPQERIANDALRVAEGIVHEAMHLQLTLIEQIVQLVLSDGEKYFSPWRDEHRSAQGVLHALYVFAVIDCFIADLQLRSVPPPKSANYLKRRRTKINNQMREVAAFGSSSALTELGRRFVKGLFIL